MFAVKKKKKKRFVEFYTCFGYETKTGVERISVIFHCRSVKPHQWKALAETFEWYVWTYAYVEK